MLFVAGALTVTSCKYEEPDAIQDSEMSQVTFSLDVENLVTTRTISDGTNIDKLVYAVYDTNGELIKTISDANSNGQFVIDNAFNEDLQTSISITLAKAQTYTVAFWAQDGDCKAYNTDDLTAVKVSYKAVNGTDNAVNNDEMRDAFFAAETFTVNGNVEIDVTLKRPFAQINVGVTSEDWQDALNSKVKITKSAVVLEGVANSINLLTGEATGDETVTYALSDIPSENLYVDTDNNGTKEEYKWLSMSYVLAPSNKTTLDISEFTFTPERGNNIIFSEGLNSVPVERNWRTNILGRILTGNIQFNITIDTVWDDDTIYPDGTLKQELEFAATFGGTVTLTNNLRFTEPLTVGADMILNMNGKTLEGSINLLNGARLTVDNGSIINTDSNVSGITSNGDLTLNDVNIKSARHALRIESGSAVINGGTYKVVPIVPGMTMHALNVGDNGTAANVTIKDGIFIGPEDTDADSGSAVKVYSGSSVTIEGGNFSGGKNETISNYGEMTITGGIFDQEPNSTWIPKGSKIEIKSDNYEVIERKYTYVSKVEDLISAIASGGDVMLKNDIKPTNTIDIKAGKDVYLDLNGKTITIDETLEFNNGYQYAFIVREGGTLVIDGDGVVEATTPAPIMFYPGGDLVIENGTFIRRIPEGYEGGATSMFVGTKPTGGWHSSGVTINGGYFDCGYYPTLLKEVNIEDLIAGTETLEETETDIAKRGQSGDPNPIRKAIKSLVSVSLNLSNNYINVYGGTFVGANPAWGDEGCMLPTTPNYLRPWSYYQGGFIEGQEFNPNGIVLPEGYSITKGTHEDGRPTYTVNYNK